MNGAESGIALDPTIRSPARWRLITVPANVIAGSPAEIVVPALEKAVGFGVNVWPATVREE